MAVQQTPEAPTAPSTVLLDLPNECILRMMRFLEDPRHLLGFESTCKRIWRLGHEPEAWSLRLAENFDLRVQTTDGTLPDLQDLFARVAQSEKKRLLRFEGCFTDGGCDNDLHMYWVDHLFTANHWHSYCSASSKNVNCIGLLSRLSLKEPKSDSHWPDEERHRRNHMMQRCLLPHGLMTRTIRSVGPYGVTSEEQDRAREMLDRLSTSELEHLLAELFALFQERTPMGRLLFCNVRAEDFLAEVERVRIIVDEMRMSQSQRLRDAGISISTSCPEVLMDSRAVIAAAENPASYAGIVEGITINRMGNFSCPVRTGVVSMASLPHPESARTAMETTAKNLKALLSSRACRRLQSVTSIADLVQGIDQGELPPVVAYSLNHAGKWLEFDPAWRHPDDPNGQPYLRPAVWFQFWDRLSAHSFCSVCSALERDPATGEHCPKPQKQRLGPLHTTLEKYLQVHRSRQQSTEPQNWIPEDGWHHFLRQEFAVWEQLIALHMNEVVHEIGTYEANFIQEQTEEGELRVVDPRFNMNKLEIKLKHKRCGNCAVVKLIDQENLMAEWRDTHDAPNVDVAHVAFEGRQIRLLHGVQLEC